MSELPGSERVGGRRIGRRAVLGLPVRRAPAAQPAELDVSRYADWIARYRRGELAEVVPEIHEWGTWPLASAQRRRLEGLGRPDTRSGFQERLVDALFHAELMASLGRELQRGLELVGEPLRGIRSEWPPGVPDAHREAAVQAWGERRTENFRDLLRREVFLMLARTRLAELDNGNARRVLAYARDFRDPAVEWQFAVTSLIQVRYLRDEGLSFDAVRDLRRSVSRWKPTPADTDGGRRSIVRAIGDPDDLQLRLAMVELGRGKRRAAAARLGEVREEVAPRLVVPRLLLEAELDLRGHWFRPAMGDLREARRAEPTSPAAVVALVAAEQAAGRWDEAAALATDFLSGGERARPWFGFITSWAEPGEGLPWLRQVAGVG